MHFLPQVSHLLRLHRGVVSLEPRWRHDLGIEHGGENGPPAVGEGGGVRGADDIAYGLAGAVVENEARGGGEVDVSFVPEEGADGAGGLLIGRLVDCREELLCWC